MDVVYRNGKAYDKETGRRVFIKPPVLNDKGSSGTNTLLDVEKPTEAVVEASEGIVKPPVKRMGRPPKPKA
jgi:hypothetical protein